jgi:NO-binding membrane sensor protein with MHYT domain
VYVCVCIIIRVCALLCPWCVYVCANLCQHEPMCVCVCLHIVCIISVVDAIMVVMKVAGPTTMFKRIPLQDPAVTDGKGVRVTHWMLAYRGR